MEREVRSVGEDEHPKTGFGYELIRFSHRWLFRQNRRAKATSSFC